MRANCERHPFEFSEDLCDHCGHDFCGECLVFARGPRKPPICVTCALVASGVRPPSSRPEPRFSRRELKRVRRERQEQNGAAPAQPGRPVPATLSFRPDDFEPVAEPAPAEDDWDDVPTWGPSAFSTGG